MGSCNFCNRQVTEHGVSVREPITIIRGTECGIARLCDDCLTELRKQIGPPLTPI